MKARGTVRAVVFPVTIGERLPVWTDSIVAFDLIGTHRPPEPRGASGFLAEASQGLFRLEASVFPPLIDVNTDPVTLSDRLLTPEGIRDLVRDVVQTWGARVNLAAYDNDGPDGHPLSGDDDGFLDLPVIILETDSTPALVHVPIDLSIPVGKDGRFHVKAGTVHVLAVPRQGRMSSSDIAMATLLLGAMGLEGPEMFFPASFEKSVSTLARLRLGWIRPSWTPKSGTYLVELDNALVVPVVDVDSNRGLWLLERTGESIYMTRVARKRDGHFAVVEIRHIRKGDESLTVPLTDSAGDSGPHLRVEWVDGGEPLAEVALSGSDGNG